MARARTSVARPWAAVWLLAITLGGCSRTSVEVWVAADWKEAAPACPDDTCVVRSIADVSCSDRPVATIIVAGHASPPTYLGLPPTQLAELIVCRRPELVVLDVCYGASTPIYRAIAQRAERVPLLVGASFWIGRRGLLYDGAFFDASQPAEVRAGAVRSNSGRELLVWRPEDAPLAAVDAEVAALTPEAVRAQRFRFGPSLLRRRLPDGREIVVAREP